MLNIIIPMAGLGSRFSKAGYELPKPLINVHGLRMIELVIKNLRPSRSHKFIFVCQNAHIKKYELDSLLPQIAGKNSEVIGIDGVTDGAARTVLLGLADVSPDEPLLIANSDQFIDCDINDFLSVATNSIDGLIMTMKANDEKWSFVSLDSNNKVKEVVEKVVISDEATVGIYYFSKTGDFVSAAYQMIEKKETSNGEYYVAPVYNYLIKDKAKIDIFNIGRVGDGMYGLGTPADLEEFLSLPDHHFRYAQWK